MGLLDDAIREHLDLKRRHGADPAEVERAEREALGPVRRGAEPQDQVDLGDEDVLIPEDEATLIDEQNGLPYDEEEAEEWEDVEPGAPPPLEFEDEPFDHDHESVREE